MSASDNAFERRGGSAEGRSPGRGASEFGRRRICRRAAEHIKRRAGAGASGTLALMHEGPAERQRDDLFAHVSGGWADDLEAALADLSSGYDFQARNAAGDTLLDAAVRMYSSRKWIGGGLFRCAEQIDSRGPLSLVLNAIPEAERATIIGLGIRGGHSALHLAADTGDPKALRLLLDSLPVQDREGMVSARGKDGLNVMDHIKNNRGARKVAALLGDYPELVVDDNGRNGLHHLAAEGNLEAVQKLLSGDPSRAAVTDFRGGTPMHRAAHGGHVDLVKELLSVARGTASMTDSEGYTPMHVAAYRGRADIVRAMVESYPQGVAVGNRDGLTPIHVAVEEGHVDVIKAIANTLADARDAPEAPWRPLAMFSLILNRLLMS